MKKLLITLIAVIPPLALAGQDTQYWTLLPGTRSALLGGAVIGGTTDNTAIFYNPGSLGFIDTSSISINASLYRIDNIKIENALGKEKDFKSMNFSAFPLLISGILRTKNPRLKIGYGITTNVDFDFRATARLDGNFPIVADTESPGDEAFIGQASISSQLKETTGGVALSWKIGERWSAGLTNMVTVRNANYIRATLARFFLNTPGSPLVSSNIIQSFNYTHFRYTAKAGIAWHGRRADLGLTIASPGVRFLGKGNVAADITGNDILFNNERTDILANDRQVKLKTEYRSPFNIAAGANFRFRRSSLGIAAQYNGSEDPYDILQAKPAAFARPPDLYPALGSEEFLRVKGAARSVWNATIGYEYMLNEAFTLYGSLRSDMSYYDNDINDLKGIKPDISSWDIYHLVLGAAWKRGRSTITFGIQAGTGKDDTKEQEGNLSSPNESNFLLGSTTITKASYSSVGIMLGYSFSFRKF